MRYLAHTLAMIRQSGEEPEIVEYLKTPPSRAWLIELIESAGLTVPAALRQKDTPYETLGLGDTGLADEALLDAMMAHPILINRPIVVTATGVNAPQYAVLASLEDEPGASNARLTRRAFVTPQTMQAMLVKLEQSGLIERRPDTEHGRIQRTELTEKGRSSLAQAHLAAQKSERLARQTSTPGTVEMLTSIAEALA